MKIKREWVIEGKKSVNQLNKRKNIELIQLVLVLLVLFT